MELSCLVLNTGPEAGDFLNALDFYCEKLGFIVVCRKPFIPVQGSGLGNALEEAWISLMPSSAASSRPDSSQDVATSFNIHLKPSSALEKKPNSIYLHLSSTLLERVAQLDPSYEGLGYCHVVDPLGNEIELHRGVSVNKSKLVTRDKAEHLSTKAASRMPPLKRIGMLTSGGDSPGMNAAVRAITRYAITKNCQPYAIFEGYQGLVDGGDKIKELGWENVRGFLSLGGTSIGTARCMAFKERKGRLDSCANLVKNGIDALIIIGGDGSLTGADILRSEWPGLLEELIAEKRIERIAADRCRHLTIVGLVGSIDNDMSSTDITIGAVTSLHRICEAVDCLSSTALSHQRAFVVEVMGRHCGWLALMAAIATSADWVFLPERPPPFDLNKEWESEMCERIQHHRSLGNRKSIIIVSEGAIDRNLKPIKSDYVRQVIETRLQLDTRVTNLGHVQRGGKPCAFDRSLATIQGVKAVDAVLAATPTTPSPLIGISQNKITMQPLMEAVRLTHEVSSAIIEKDFKRAMELRDPDFNAAYNAYVESTIMASRPNEHVEDDSRRFVVGIVHVGAPAGGMNAATASAVRLCLNRGHTPLAILGGLGGLLRGHVRPLSWDSVNEWVTKGGSELGTSREQPRPLYLSHAAVLSANQGGAGGEEISATTSNEYLDLGGLAFAFQRYGLSSLLVIGGFEAYSTLMTLGHSRPYFPAFCIPMVHLPATVSNNVPGTDFSIGCDTALNAIVDACDCIKQSAAASRSRVFVVEVQGGRCGYLAVVGGLTTGATNVYIPENELTLNTVAKDVRHLCRRYTEEVENEIRPEGRLILRNEKAGEKSFTTEVISNIFKGEGRGLFDSRTAILGHLQQGNIPSPLDRIRAVRLAVDCIDWLESWSSKHFKPAANGRGTRPEVFTTAAESLAVIGIRGASVVFTPVHSLLKETDLKQRKPKDSWWMGIHRMTKIMSKYEFYEKFDSQTENCTQETPLNDR